MLPEACLFHSDRLLFNTVLRDLRRCGIIARAHLRLMAMTVCSCRKKAPYRQELTKHQVCSAAEHVTKEVLEDRQKKLTVESYDLITSSSNIARRCWPSVTSHARFVVVISQALLDKPLLLMEEREGASKKAVTVENPSPQAAVATNGSSPFNVRGVRGRVIGANEPMSPSRARPRRKLSSNIIRRIIKRKKERCSVQAKFCIPLFGGMTNALFSKPHIGQNFSRMCVKNACVLEIDSVATAKYMKQNRQTTVVTAWCPSNDVLAKVQRDLTKDALTLQAAHNACARERAARHCEEKMLILQSSTLLDVKDVMRRNFEKKTKGRHRELNPGRVARGRNPVKRKDGSTFEEGHCLNCLLPFKLNAFSEGTPSCRHHPGYLQAGKWTCCQESSPVVHPTHEDHIKDGCTVGHHLWRPHKAVSRGYRAQKPKMYCKYSKKYKIHM